MHRRAALHSSTHKAMQTSHNHAAAALSASESAHRLHGHVFKCSLRKVLRLIPARCGNRSAPRAQGETVSSTFKSAGTYEYYCEPHQGAQLHWLYPPVHSQLHCQ